MQNHEKSRGRRYWQTFQGMHLRQSRVARIEIGGHPCDRLDPDVSRQLGVEPQDQLPRLRCQLIAVEVEHLHGWGVGDLGGGVSWKQSSRHQRCQKTSW